MASFFATGIAFMNKTFAFAALACIALTSIFSSPTWAADDRGSEPSAALKAAREVEKATVETIKKALPAFVFIQGGSAVLISPDGYVLTNYHVVRDEKYMLVRNNSKTYLAVTQGTNPRLATSRC